MRHLNGWVFCMGLGLMACEATNDEGPTDDTETDTETDIDTDVDTSRTTVTFTTYTNDTCTELPPKDSVVHLDTTLACNETPDGSISSVVCQPDRITYTNYPNNSDCSSTGIPNELEVGVCQEFPGPAVTYKYIEPDTYNCLSAPAG